MSTECWKCSPERTMGGNRNRWIVLRVSSSSTGFWGDAATPFWSRREELGKGLGARNAMIDR